MIAVLAWGSREGASPIMATRRTPPRLGAPIADRAQYVAGRSDPAARSPPTGHLRREHALLGLPLSGDERPSSHAPALERFSKRQRVAPRGKPSRVQAKAVVGRSVQNGRNDDSSPEKYCGYFSFDAAVDCA